MFEIHILWLLGGHVDLLVETFCLGSKKYLSISDVLGGWSINYFCWLLFVVFACCLLFMRVVCCLCVLFVVYVWRVVCCFELNFQINSGITVYLLPTIIFNYQQYYHYFLNHFKKLIIFNHRNTPLSSFGVYY